MSRHRTVRTMNYDDEYEGYYGEYGHSVEDDYCISPSTAAEFMYDRTSKTHSISAFLNPECITEEEEEKKPVVPKSEHSAVPKSKINYIDQQKLHACVESMQNVVGETIPESTLAAAAISYNYNLEQALDAVLTPGDAPPKPQRVPRQRNRMLQDTKTEEEEKSHKIATKPQESINLNYLKTEKVGDNPTLTKEASLISKDINEDKKKLLPGSCNNFIFPESSPVTDTSNERITPDKEKPLISENSNNTNEAFSASKTSKLKSSVKDLQAEYQKERGDAKPLINMVVIGHVDAGKSTLMGHLLYRLGCVGKKIIHKYEQDSKKLGKASFMYAWVLDETNEERTRGITMDVAQSRFETPHHVITLLDAPGHKDFIPNMITGAAQADVAVLVVDATRGEFETGFEAGGQTREHTMLVRSLGVSQLAVAVNKLDNVEWCKDRYNEIVCKLGSFLKQTGYRENDVTFVPCSGLTGENLTETAKNASLTTWYNGPCLVEVIDKFKPPERPIKKPFRLSTSDVYKGMGSGFCVAGRIEAGHVRNADRLMVMPAAEPVSVKGISIDERSVTQAFAGDHVIISLLGGDINKVTTGSVLCDLNQPIKATNRFQSRIVTFNIEIPITKGFPVILHQQSLSEQAVIKKLVSQLHKSTGQVVRKKPRCITKNSSAVIELEVNRPICVELYKDMRELGRFMLRSGGTTIAAGVVTEIL